MPEVIMPATDMHSSSMAQTKPPWTWPMGLPTASAEGSKAISTRRSAWLTDSMRKPRVRALPGGFLDARNRARIASSVRVCGVAETTSFGAMSLTPLFLAELVEGDDLGGFFAAFGRGDDLGFRLRLGLLRRDLRSLELQG